MARENGTRIEHLLAELQRAFTDALLRGDELLAEAVLREGIEAGLEEAAIDDDVIAPSLHLIGDLWAAGELTIGEEHLATEIALRCVALHREAFRMVRRRVGTTVVLAAVEGEQHVVGLKMAASLLVHAGYTVRMLGASVPTHALAVVVDRHDPSVVALSATMAGAAEEMLEAVGVVRAVRPHAGVLLGGAGVPNRLIDQPGQRRCERVGDAVALVDALAQRASMN